MITVLLINPPLTIRQDAPRVVHPPIGLAYLASVLRKKPSTRVSMLDCVAEGPGCESSAMPGFVTYGLSLDEVQTRLARERPAVVGISFVSSDQARNAHKICERIKQLKRDKDIDITVVAGGPHVTAFPQDVMSDLNVDYAIVGEAEQALVKLVDCIERYRPPDGIPGLCYRDRRDNLVVNREMELTTNLDEIPFPSYDLLQMQRYTFADSVYHAALKPHLPMVLYRGCQFHCAHCQVPRLSGNELRKRSPENIIAEMRMLKEAFDVKEVQFVGDNLFGDRAWAKSWMTAIERAQLEMRWSTLSGQSLYNIDAETATLAIQSGLRSLMLDFPCGDTDTYEEVYQRPGDLDGIGGLVTAMRRAGVWVGGLFSFGAPGESKSTMLRTLSFANSLHLDEVRFRVMTPYPGTPLWERCVARKQFEIVPGADDLLYDGGYVNTSQLSSRDVRRFQQMALTQQQTARFLMQPHKMPQRLLQFAVNMAVHPIQWTEGVFRYCGSVVGLYAPPLRKTGFTASRKKPRKRKPEDSEI